MMVGPLWSTIIATLPGYLPWPGRVAPQRVKIKPGRKPGKESENE